MDSEKSNPQEKLKGVANAIGGMTKMRRKEIYFGSPPKDAYMGFDVDIKHIHDLRMSDEQKHRLYGIKSRARKETTPSVGELTNIRLENDSKADLIREIAESSNLTRKDAEQVVELWMLRNDLVEENGPFGKIIVPKH